jgi:hypothetical protein
VARLKPQGQNASLDSTRKLGIFGLPEVISISALLLTLGLFISSYFERNLLEFLSYFPSDGWCLNDQRGLGVHCFGDFGAGGNLFSGGTAGDFGLTSRAGNLVFGTSSTERMRIDSSGNLGLGVTPSAWSAGLTALQLTNGGVLSTQTSTVLLSQNKFNNAGDKYISNGFATDYYQQNGVHAWRTAPSGTAGNAITFTQALTLDASGNLLLGTTAGSSTERLSVLSANSSNNKVTAQIYNTAATSTTRLDNRLTRIASNGSNADVSIQFTDSVTNNYFFGGNNGGAYVVANTNGVRLANGGTSWASDSDERVKDIIEPITDAANKVSTLRAVIGKYKTDEEGTRRAFLIAQDVQAVLPEAVFDEQGTLMLQYTDTIPLLVAAIKELKAEFDAYKATHP